MKISWPAIAIIILGILLIIGPWTFAPVCEVMGSYAQLASGKTIPMPCGWTARAEIGIGALVVLAGVLLAIAQSAEAKRIIGVFGAALGVLAILFPTYITRMCAMAEHPCNTMTKPTLVIIGLVIIVISAYVIYQSKKNGTNGHPA